MALISMRWLWPILMGWSASCVASGAGWRWYQETPPEVKPKPPAITRTITTATPTQPKPKPTPVEQFKAIQEKYQNARAEALMHPTVNNVMTVMRWHQYFLKKSDQFGTAFEKALLADPTLSYRAQYPVESLARQTYSQVQHDKERSVISGLAQAGLGLMFVYRGQDPFAQTLAPSLVKQAQTWHLPLVGLSNDGVFLPVLPFNRRNMGEVNAAVTPAIYLVNPKTKVKKAIAFGFISMAELTKHLTQVATNYQVQ